MDKIEEFNLEEAIAWGQLTAVQRFEGLKNTQELKDTVSEMFNGVTSTIEIENVQGSTDKFHCTLTSNAKEDDEIANIISTFERNTFITTKISKYT